VLWERRDHEADPVTLARRYLDGADIILAEGFSPTRSPRSKCTGWHADPTRCFGADAAGADQWVAMVTDNPTFRAPFPILRFNDNSLARHGREPRLGSRQDPRALTC